MCRQEVQAGGAGGGVQAGGSGEPLAPRGHLSGGLALLREFCEEHGAELGHAQRRGR